MKRLGKLLLTLSPEYRAMLARALPLVLAVRVALWVLPYRVVRDALERSAPQPAERLDSEAARMRQKSALWAVDAVSRRLLRKKPCLVQALVARWLLAREGGPTVLAVGVAMGPDRKFEAHAWLEHEGRIVIGGAGSPAKYAKLRPIGMGAAAVGESE